VLSRLVSCSVPAATTHACCCDGGSAENRHLLARDRVFSGRRVRPGVARSYFPAQVRMVDQPAVRLRLGGPDPGGVCFLAALAKRSCPGRAPRKRLVGFDDRRRGVGAGPGPPDPGGQSGLAITELDDGALRGGHFRGRCLSRWWDALGAALCVPDSFFPRGGAMADEYRTDRDPGIDAGGCTGQRRDP